MKKIVTTLFIFGCFVSALAHAQELNQSSVASMWPYPGKVIKVVAASGTLKREGKTIKMAEVIAQSETTKKCVNYQTTFKKTGSGWEFDDVTNQYEVSCKSLTAKEGSTGNNANYGNQNSADPRDHVEEGVGEVNRTVDDVDAVTNTVERVKSLF